MLHEHVYMYISIFIMWVYNTRIPENFTIEEHEETETESKS